MQPGEAQNMQQMSSQCNSSQCPVIPMFLAFLNCPSNPPCTKSTTAFTFLPWIELRMKDEDTGDRIRWGHDQDSWQEPPRGDQVDLHAICSECVRVQQGFDCRLWFLMKKIPTMHKINKIKKLLPLSINYKTHSCDSFDFKLWTARFWFLMKKIPTMQKINKTRQTCFKSFCLLA